MLHLKAPEWEMPKNVYFSVSDIGVECVNTPRGLLFLIENPRDQMCFRNERILDFRKVMQSL